MRVGDVIDNRFVLNERAGAGGMGAVFRAHDVAQDRVVAIKFLSNDHGDNASRFFHESSILIALDHPHIVRHIAQGVLSSGNPWLAMEWLKGEDLAARLVRGGLSLDDGLLLVRLVADALGPAHARGVVHRDVKPSNIFLVNLRHQHVCLSAQCRSGSEFVGELANVPFPDEGSPRLRTA